MNSEAINIHQNKCNNCAKKVLWFDLWDSLFQALFKVVIGVLTHSHALIGNALYSINDVVSCIAILVGIKVSDSGVDDEHPYGRGHMEYIISVLVSFFILGCAVYVGVEAFKIILKNEHYPVNWVVLIVAFITGFDNTISYRYARCVQKHINSPAFLTHAQHYKADIISSGAVIIAIIGGKMGFAILDPIVAIFEAGHLIIVSVEVFYHGSLGLLDRSMSVQTIDYINWIVSGVPDVVEVKDVRARQIGRSFWVDLKISLPAGMIIAEAERISENIKQILKKKIRYLGNVHVIYE